MKKQKVENKKKKKMRKQKVEKKKMNMKMKMKIMIIIIKMKMMIKQWIKTKKPEIIKGLNDNLDEIIDKSKSFEDQIKSIRKVKNLDDYYYVNDFGDKELKFKIFKLKLAHLSNEIDENLFEQIFDHKFETLANKLINTTDKEENQIIVKNIEKNKDKLFEMDKFNDWVIQPSDRRINLKDAIDLILDFNEELNQIWFKNIKIKK